MEKNANSHLIDLIVMKDKKIEKTLFIKDLSEENLKDNSLLRLSYNKVLQNNRIYLPIGEMSLDNYISSSGSREMIYEINKRIISDGLLTNLPLSWMFTKLIQYAFYLEMHKEAQSEAVDQIQDRFENMYNLAIERKYKVGLFSNDQSIQKTFETLYNHMIEDFYEPSFLDNFSTLEHLKNDFVNKKKIQF